MRLLVDECLSPNLAGVLREEGHDVAFVGRIARGLGDPEVLEIARREGRVLLTFDKDFGALAFGRGRPHAGLLRLRQVTPRKQVLLLPGLLRQFADPLARGAVVTVRASRISVREPRRSERKGGSSRGD